MVISKRVSGFGISLVLCIYDSSPLRFDCSDNELVEVNVHCGSVTEKKTNNIIYMRGFKGFLSERQHCFHLC